MTLRQREIAVIMLMAFITIKLGNNLTKTVNQFRRSLRRYLNKLHKHEASIYKEAHTLAETAWEKSFNDREKIDNLSVGVTLQALNTLINDVTWVRKNIYTQKQIEAVYFSIMHDRDEPITDDMVEASKDYIDTIATELGMVKPTQLKLRYMIKNLKEKQNDSTR